MPSFRRRQRCALLVAIQLVPLGQVACQQRYEDIKSGPDKVRYLRNEVIGYDQALRRTRTTTATETTTTTQTHPISLDPKTVEVKADWSSRPPRGRNQNKGAEPSRRKFVAYHSSPWETLWLENVDFWAETKSICHYLVNEQSEQVHDFLNLTCTSRMPPPYQRWCVIDDSYQPLWYDTGNRRRFALQWERPFEIPDYVPVPPPKPVLPGPEHEHIVSKLVFLDEATGERYHEYIEPLVSHLRFPLCKCIEPVPGGHKYAFRATSFRGWIIPPPPRVRKDRSLYFDAGASSWDRGLDGPSVRYFVTLWGRHGINFDEIFVFDRKTTPREFYRDVPKKYLERIHYQQCVVSSSPEEDSAMHPFLPSLIAKLAEESDYVLFKLDIDDLSRSIEDSFIALHMLDEYLNLPIDEFLWEQHVRGNYLLEEWRGEDGSSDHLLDLTLRESYEFFLELRQRGIRAHSWI